jgi:hypothetical protein
MSGPIDFSDIPGLVTIEAAPPKAPEYKHSNQRPHKKPTFQSVLAKDKGRVNTAPVRAKLAEQVEQPKPQALKWHKVSNSDHINRVMYDGGVLTVEFTGNAKVHYAYSDVTPQQFQALMKADSPNGYLQKHIIPNHKVVRVPTGESK